MLRSSTLFPSTDSSNADNMLKTNTDFRKKTRFLKKVYKLYKRKSLLVS
jgi:hypothetical protein